MLRSLIVLFWCVVSTAVLKGEASSTLDGVVLVIADGTSMELLTAARVYRHGAQGRLAIEKMPRTAFVRTYSSSDVVTDSAAAATAMARGARTRNRAVGAVDPPQPSILDLAKEAGWSTAVVVDDEVTGGTPAPFILEHPEREEAWEIAGKLVEKLGKRVDIVAGGGEVWFRDFGVDEYPPEIRELVQATQKKLAAAPARFITTWKDYVQLAESRTADETPILATFWPHTFPYVADHERVPRLVEMTEQTVKLLRLRGKPFLLVVEASLPDKAAHKNNGIRAIREVLEMDAAVAWLLENLTPNTLLLVTTDHGTSGLALNGYMPLRVKGDAILGTNPLTGAPVLTWASGPGGAPEANRYERVSIGEEGSRTETLERLPTDPDYMQPAAVNLPSGLHTGGDVWLLGSGPGSEKVHGFLDNTDIFGIMRDAVTGKP